MATAVIGRVAIKVMPDTSDFKSDLEESLKKATSGVEIEVPVRVDDSQVRAEVARSVRAVNASIKGDDAFKIKLRAQIVDTRDAVAKAAREMQIYAAGHTIEFQSRVISDKSYVPDGSTEQGGDQVKRVHEVVPVSVMVDDTQLDKLKADLAALTGKKWKVDVLTRVKEAVSKSKSTDKDSDSDYTDLGMDATQIIPRLDKSTAARTAAALAILARDRIANIRPNIDKSALASSMGAIGVAVGTAAARLSGLRFGKDFLKDSWDAVASIDQLAVKVAFGASSMVGMITTAIQLASALFALSHSLALIGSMALALPGMLVASSLALGALGVALADINNRMPELQSKWQSLKPTIQDNFWGPALEPMRSAVNTLFPIFLAGMGNLSTSIGQFAAMASKVATIQFAPTMPAMFAAMAQAVDILKLGLPAAALSLNVLGLVGTAVLPALSGWLVKLNQGIALWLKANYESGQIMSWIGQGAAELQAIGSIIVSLVMIMKGLGDAAKAAGYGGFIPMANGFRSLADAINSAGVQEKLTLLFAAGLEGGREFGKVGPTMALGFSALGSVLSSIMPIVGQISAMFIGGLVYALSSVEARTGAVSMFAQIRNGMTTLLPALASLGPAFGGLYNVIGAMANALGGILAVALGMVGGKIASLSSPIMTIINILGSGLAAALAGLGPSLTAAMDGIIGLIAIVAETIGPIVSTVVAALTQMGSSAAPVISQVFGILQSILGPVMVQIGALAAQWLPQLSAAFGALMAAVGPLLTILQSLVSAILPPLLAILGVVVGFIMGAVIGIFNGLTNVITGVVNVFQGFGALFAAIFAGDIPGILAAFGQIFLGIWQMLVGAFEIFINIGIFKVLRSGLTLTKGIWDDVWNAIKSAGQAIWNFIKSFFKNFMDDIGRFMSGGLGAVKTVWTAAWNGIKALATTIWNALKSAFSNFINGVKSFMSSGTAGVKSVWDNAWNAIRNFASSVWSSIRSAASSFISGVQSVISSGVSSVRSAFQSGLSALSSIASSIWSSVRSAFSSGVSSAVSVARGLGGQVAGAVGNLGGILVNAGRSVIQGFISGIQGMIGSVRSTLSSLTSMLPSWKGPADRDRVLLFDAGRLVIDGFINGLESRYDAVRKSLQGLSSDVGNTEIDSPNVAGIAAAAASWDSSLRTPGGAGSNKTLNYYAAPGSSLGSEEDLFMAMGRGRAQGW
jgi:phage-related protein